MVKTKVKTSGKTAEAKTSKKAAQTMPKPATVAGKNSEETPAGRVAKKASTNVATAHPRKPSDSPVVNRRTQAERRKSVDRRTRQEPVAVERRTFERRAKVSRRRQIDPTTCERDYTGDELEFMGALDEYKRTSGRMFPTCSEVLEVIRGLGYEKRSEEESTPAIAEPALTEARPGQPAEAVAV
jgi:DNA polymerase II large subunit